jgi:hypothetical protein
VSPGGCRHECRERLQVAFAEAIADVGRHELRRVALDDVVAGSTMRK